MMAKIAWIGTGVMGASMAKHLLRNGHEVNMYSKTIAKAEKVREEEKAARDAKRKSDDIKRDSAVVSTPNSGASFRIKRN